MVATILIYYFFLNVSRNDGGRAWLLYAFAVIFGCYVHILAFFIVLGLACCVANLAAISEVNRKFVYKFSIITFLSVLAVALSTDISLILTTLSSYSLEVS